MDLKELLGKELYKQVKEKMFVASLWGLRKGESLPFGD